MTRTRTWKCIMLGAVFVSDLCVAKPIPCDRDRKRSRRQYEAEIRSPRLDLETV